MTSTVVLLTNQLSLHWLGLVIVPGRKSAAVWQCRATVRFEACEQEDGRDYEMYLSSRSLCNRSNICQALWDILCRSPLSDCVSVRQNPPRPALRRSSVVVAHASACNQKISRGRPRLLLALFALCFLSRSAASSSELSSGAVSCVHHTAVRSLRPSLRNCAVYAVPESKFFESCRQPPVRDRRAFYGLHSG